jgi:hypothetical protein
LEPDDYEPEEFSSLLLLASESGELFDDEDGSAGVICAKTIL